MLPLTTIKLMLLYKFMLELELMKPTYSTLSYVS